MNNKPQFDIDHYYRVAAKIVQIHGDFYLPLFERVHRERELLLKSRGLKALAFSVIE